MAIKSKKEALAAMKSSLSLMDKILEKQKRIGVLLKKQERLIEEMKGVSKEASEILDSGECPGADLVKILKSSEELEEKYDELERECSELSREISEIEKEYLLLESERKSLWKEAGDFWRRIKTN